MPRASVLASPPESEPAQDAELEPAPPPEAVEPAPLARAPAEASPSPSRTPRATASVERPLRRLPPPSTDAPPVFAPRAEPRRSTEHDAPVRKERIRIDRDEGGLAEFLQQQIPLHRERVIPGVEGSVIFVDDAAWRRFRLLAQRSLRLADGRLRVEVDVRSRDRRRNARLRVAFLDEQGRQTEVSPIIPERFMGDYTRTVLFASAGTRSTGYLILFADD